MQFRFLGGKICQFSLAALNLLFLILHVVLQIKECRHKFKFKYYTKNNYVIGIMVINTITEFVKHLVDKMWK